MTNEAKPNNIKLLKKENIDRSISDSFGYSPIHVAISKDFPEIAKLLIEANFNTNLQDSKGQTALHYCAFYNNLIIAELLLSSGARLDIPDNYGNQSLWTAVFNDKGFGRRIEMIKLFLKYGADKNHKNNVQLSPIEIAVMGKYKDVLAFLNG